MQDLIANNSEESIGTFRYLLTAIGALMPGLFIAQKVRENRFKVGRRPTLNGEAEISLKGDSYDWNQISMEFSRRNCGVFSMWLIG